MNRHDAHLDPVLLEGVHCRMVVCRVRPDVLLLCISGSDIGELGEAPFRALEKGLAHRPCRLFIDARGTRGASIEVSHAWSRWLDSRRESFRRISMLCSSRLVEITAGFAQRFAGLGELMQITTCAEDFDRELAAACGGVVPELGCGMSN